MNLLFAIALPAMVATSNWLPAAPAELDAFTRKGDITWNMGATKDGRLSCAVMGTAGNELAFLIFTMGPPGGKPFICPVRGWTNYRQLPNGDMVRKTEAYLSLTGGGKVRLPLRAQLVEVGDEKVDSSDQRVTLAEAKAFLSSHRQSLTLQDLLRFVDGRRNKPEK